MTANGAKALSLLALAALISLLASSCSEMERSGISNRPQNAPSDWEQQRTVINSEK